MNEINDIKFIGSQAEMSNWLNTIDGMMKMGTATECQKKEIDNILSTVPLSQVKYLNVPQAKKFISERWNNV